MEDFDILQRNLNIQKIVDRVLSLGYPIEQSQSTKWNREKTLTQCLTIINLFIKQHEQQSIIKFMVDLMFIKIKSKKEVGKYCFDLIYSLQENSNVTKEHLIILMLFCVDYSLDLTSFYIATRIHIIDYFTITNQNIILDDIEITLDDWVTLCSKIFYDSNTQQLIIQMTSLINQEIQLKSDFNPYKILSGGRFQQVCLKFYMDQRRQHTDSHMNYDRVFENNHKIPNESLGKFSGFYRWSSPLFKRKEFLNNPINLRMLHQLKVYRQMYPVENVNQVRATSPLRQNKSQNKSNQLTPVKQSQVNSKERLYLKRELATQIKEKNQFKLKFNLLLSYYSNMKGNQIHLIKDLEDMYEQYESMKGNVHLSDNDNGEYQMKKNQLQQQREQIENYERDLRKSGLLPPSFLDDLHAASKRKFQEPHRQNTQQSQRNRTGSFY